MAVSGVLLVVSAEGNTRMIIYRDDDENDDDEGCLYCNGEVYRSGLCLRCYEAARDAAAEVAWEDRER